MSINLAQGNLIACINVDMFKQTCGNLWASLGGDRMHANLSTIFTVERALFFNGPLILIIPVLRLYIILDQFKDTCHMRTWGGGDFLEEI